MRCGLKSWDNNADTVDHGAINELSRDLTRWEQVGGSQTARPEMEDGLDSGWRMAWAWSLLLTGGPCQQPFVILPNFVPGRTLPKIPDQSGDSSNQSLDLNLLGQDLWARQNSVPPARLLSKGQLDV